MATCMNCQKSDPAVVVGRLGLCVDCLEAELSSAQDILSMIRQGGDLRKRALEQIDADFAEEFAERIREPLKSSTFTKWSADEHGTTEQLDRIRRSAKVKVLDYDQQSGVATIKGSGKEPYQTTLDSCSCADYAIRQLPCKHIYKVAALYGGISLLRYLEA